VRGLGKSGILSGAGTAIDADSSKSWSGLAHGVICHRASMGVKQPCLANGLEGGQAIR
jgi:hypothetical protein